MTFEEIFTQLQVLGTEQTRKSYLRHGSGPNVFGASFATYGVLKKQFVGRGKDKTLAHGMARQLWHTQNIDAQSLATMIADPQQLTEAEAEVWARDIQYYALADLLAALVAQTSFAQAKVAQWTMAPAEMLQRVGYSLVSRLALAASLLPDAFFEDQIVQMERAIQTAPNRAKEAINTAFISIGSRSEMLRALVEQAAARLGDIVIDHGDTSCQTFAIREYLGRVWARKAKPGATTQAA
ncbi:DNA alkylation repair protein [Hymenobacter elongatus]|uniref:DNA alkylation repair protein n=1 Tax=Hymenobacter elongatus TaxID=877208 RepID=A0A4Z0PLX6_9BACT|nr:DNA alkylation repair protein [Hymenobacter elongatus]TGE16408.1 DNA alkylation repair protein [Hymenobacter elongatus]